MTDDIELGSNTPDDEFELLEMNRVDLEQMLFDDDAVPKPPDGTEEPQMTDGVDVDMMDDTPDLDVELTDPELDIADESVDIDLDEPTRGEER